MKHALTLGRHLARERMRRGAAADDIEPLLRRLAFTAKAIAREARRVPLVGSLGLSGSRGGPLAEAARTLEEYAFDALLGAFEGEGLAAAIVAEVGGEVEIAALDASSRVLLCVDPLDGASNAGVNGTLGSVFGVHRRPDRPRGLEPERELLDGAPLAAAVTVMYGPATVLNYTAGDGVFGFTLDHDLGEFLLSHGLVRCPAEGSVAAAPMGHADAWPPAVRAWFTTPPKTLRYSGTVVADIHRLLLEGGVYFYPATPEHPRGKLRAFFEAAPLALLLEQAHGLALTGAARVLDHRAQALDETIPVLFGSAGAVRGLRSAIESAGEGETESP